MELWPWSHLLAPHSAFVQFLTVNCCVNVYRLQLCLRRDEMVSLAAQVLRGGHVSCLKGTSQSPPFYGNMRQPKEVTDINKARRSFWNFPMPEKLQISTAPYLVVNTSMVSCRCSTKCFFQHTSEISLAQLEASCLQAASHVFISPLPPGNKVLPETNLALSPSDDSRQLLQILVSWCFVDVYRTPVTSGSSSSNILGWAPKFYGLW
jgi:hypothetical protein